MNNNTTSKKTSFGTPEQKGNVTIYPALPAEMLRATRRGKIKTAAYVRVSTDSIQQETSLALQKESFENQIKNNSEYEFVGIYEDDGVTATNLKHRKGFLKMMEDCKAGKIDLILTKSISRFARNVGDLLSSINELNALSSPVEIRFEIENISTFSSMGEMLIIVLGILAQWESQLKSEAITWAIDKLFEQGKYYVFPLLGYDKEKGRDNPLTINEEEAKTVRLCYAMAVMGCSFTEIAKTMNELGLKSKLGNVRWTTGGVIALLSNEKYAGYVIARKTVTPNYKTHKVKKNEGEKAQYHYEDQHKPIVPPLAYEIAKRIIGNRRGNTNGIPFLKAVPEGVLKGFVVVNKALRDYTLNDYAEASRSVSEDEDNSEINIFADQASIFDLRTYDTVSALLFDEHLKPSCLIKGGKITFNAACRKALGAEKAEILFHPMKSILAIRSSADENNFQDVLITKPIHLSSFVPVALEAAELKSEYQYRIYGTKRTKNGESIMFFDLRDAKIILEEKNGCVLPKKYAERYGEGYYENLTAYDLHKIDIEGLWQALYESRPADSLAGQIVELTEFRQKSLAEFKLLEEINKNK
jgi:DNA invertase Pin-like site-specific DNA recombinase